MGRCYDFIRLGRAGYTKVMQTLQGIAQRLSAANDEIGPFEIISDGIDIPVLSFTVSDHVPYAAFEISDRLRYNGWQVPAYTMPDNATDVVVLRVVLQPLRRVCISRF